MAIDSLHAACYREGNDQRPTNERLVVTTEIRLSEIISALSVALDITQGHPKGHSMRSAMIGMRLAEEIGLPSAESSALFYALLLKDLGCSSNAAKVSYLFGADDHCVKRSLRLIDWTRPTACIKHCWTNCDPTSSPLEKVLKVVSLARSGPKAAHEISEIRCERGASIARMLQLPEATAAAIHDLDEHWNGGGTPRSLVREEITLLGRICCLAQTAEVFFSIGGLAAAIEVARERRGKWFDPRLVDALLAIKQDAMFWNRLADNDPLTELGRWEPEDSVLLADEACLDRVAEAFAMVVDAKSPWTYQHSTRVAEIAVGMAVQLDCAPDVQRDLRRAALLHDIGKLGVSNLILDKPGRPTPEELVAIQKHPDYTQQILEQVDAWQTLAIVAGAHHERLDGQGYHRRLQGSQIPWLARVLTVADICEAMSAKRPYRGAMPWDQIQAVLSNDAGKGVDRECVDALGRWHARHALPSRVEAQLAEVERMMVEF